MQKKVGKETLDLLDKEWIMFEMARSLNLEISRKVLSEYLSDTPIELKASVFKKLYEIEKCVDKGLTLALADKINYVALAKEFYGIFTANSFIKLNEEIESAIMNMLDIIFQERVSDSLICNIYDILSKVYVFGMYKDAIAILIANIFSMHEAYGKVAIVDGKPKVTFKL